jgi:ABC-type transport system substrate-binding protein
MQGSYWNKTLNRRISRRHALKVTGTSAAAAAFLAACGGDDDDDGGTSSGGSASSGTSSSGASSSGGSSGGGGGGLLTQPTYTEPKDAKRGGRLVDFTTAEPRSLDPVAPLADLNNEAAEVMEGLITEKPGKLETSQYELTGTIADSWEVTPDQITFHLRAGTKWHNVDPVNGRALDTEDILFSFQHHHDLGPLSPLVWQDRGGFAGTPSAPDESTIVIPLTIPLAYALNWFAPFGSYTGQILMFPKEADAGYDPGQKMIGTGPFYISAHEPSVSFTFTRNPDYWDQDFVLIDEIFQPIIPDYAARQAQLEAGQIHFGRPGNDIVRPTDILAIKDNTPELELYFGGTQPATSVMTFGVLGENPYKDERVRQAISMAFDRDLDIDVRSNVKELQDAGLPVNGYWNTHLGARDAYRAAGWWLDPQSSEFGENAKYFQYNLEEAKKLLSAANYPDGFDVKFAYPHAQQFDRANVVQPYFFYLQELGLNVIDNGLQDYTGGYIPMDRDASGQFEGMGYHSVTGTIPSVLDPTSALVAEHLPSSGVTFHGYSLDGGTGKTGDPALIEILEKARVEMDVETRKNLVHEAQQYLGKAMWSLMEPGQADVFMLSWPAVKNQRVYDSACQNWEKYQMWLDQTLPPFA